jgi:6-phosphogluconolactonase
VSDLVRVPTVEAMHEAGADVFVSAAVEAVTARDVFNVALAGGKTPEGVYSLLASSALLRSKVPWSQVRFFWGDERHVPPEHPDSNYRMVRFAMLDRLPIDPDHVFRIKGECPSADEAAEDYERELRTAFALKPGQFPRFDLIMLGMGADGHTASLFPGTPALKEEHRLAVGNPVDALDTDRITLTVPVLNNAAQVLFLVHGPDKADALKDVLEGPYDPERRPAQLVRPADGRVQWIVDPSAAHLL